MRKMAALTAIVMALILTSHCARPIRVTVIAGGSREDAALAAAVGWLINELPVGMTLVDVNGAPATDQFMNLVILGAAQAQMTAQSDGGLVERHGNLHIRATGPVWGGHNAAMVALQYADGERPFVGCSVSVKAAEANGTTWLVKTGDCVKVLKVPLAR